MAKPEWVKQEQERRADEDKQLEQDKAFREGQSGPVRGETYDPMAKTWK